MKIIATDDTSKAVKVTLDGNSAAIIAGGSGNWGALRLADSLGATKVSLVGGGDDNPSRLLLSPRTETFTLDGHHGTLSLGGGTVAGTQYIYNLKGQISIRIQGSNSLIALKDDKGKERIDINGAKGVVSLKNDQAKERIALNAEMAYGGFGGNGREGGFALFPASATSAYDWNQATMTFNAKAAAVAIGGKGQGGSIVLQDKAGKNSISMDAASGSIVLQDNAGKNSISIDAASGDITLQNADCAEDFDLASQAEIEPGTVVVLEENGRVRQSMDAYDKRVVGVLSGAGNLKPGLVLDRKPSLNPRAPVALMGKVHCKTDATYGAIEVGDLLTSSPTPGHAMKATDYQQAFGAVIGKALAPLSGGVGLVPILVSLR